MSDDYRPKFVFEISEQQQARCNKLLGQFGIRKYLFQPILDDVLDMLELHGDKFATAMISGIVKPREVVKSMSRAVKIAEEIDDGQLG